MMSHLDSEISNYMHGIVQLNVRLVQVIRTVHHAFRITSITLRLRNAVLDALMEATELKIIPNV